MPKNQTKPNLNAKYYFYISIKYMIFEYILLIHTYKWPNSSFSINLI